MNDQSLLENAKEAIRKVFGDTSVSRESTRENLEELLSDIEAMLGALDFDDKQEG